jgi:formylglycine-generating enzyme required for sulfatase activity
VLVPAGEFLYGEHNTPVRLPAFYIDKTEVTNAAYERFCNEKGYLRPPGFQADKPEYPVVNVTFEDARAFALWAGKSLPTAQEWEKAARGDQGWQFPWGNERDRERANVIDNVSLAKHEIMRSDSFQQGRSPCGALNMVGNVWEFVDEPTEPIADNVEYFATHLKLSPEKLKPWYEIRGAGFITSLAGKAKSGEYLYKGIWDYIAVPARWKAPSIGFRCVKDAAPAH